MNINSTNDFCKYIEVNKFSLPTPYFVEKIHTSLDLEDSKQKRTFHYCEHFDFKLKNWQPLHKKHLFLVVDSILPGYTI